MSAVHPGASAVFFVVLFVCVSASTQVKQPTVTIYSPEPHEFALALDEIQLEWMTASGRPIRPEAPREAGTARLIRREATRAVFSLRGVTTPDELVTQLRLLEAANTGARGEFVLYDPERLVPETSRRVLTRDLSVVLEDASDPGGVLERFSRALPRAASGAPAGFVITANDPLEAIQLAEALRGQPGVVSATPLLRQQQHLR